jgi:hypothetical protein
MMPAPTPLALTDSEIATVMALARPLPPDQRTVFTQLLARIACFRAAGCSTAKACARILANAV